MSLRTRLILAFAAVAVVPLVIAVAWLGQRLQATVRDEADADRKSKRLNSSHQR